MAGKGVVVPLDGSKSSEEAVPVAARLAEGLGLPLHLVHSVDEEIEGEGPRARAAQIFKAYAGRLRANATVGIVGAPAAREVVAYAEGADYVVLTSHGRGGLRANIVGSVADKIVRGATVPTLVLPAGGPAALEARPIVVAVDGSAAAEQGLAVARGLAALFKSEIVLVRAYSLPPPAGIEFIAYPVDLMTTLQEASEAYLTATAAAGERTVARLAPPVEAIRAVADEVDAGLIVMTSHGKGLAQRIALGSTTDRALHSIERPILVVPVQKG